MAQLFPDLPFHGQLIEWAQKARMRAALGWDMPPGFSSFPEEQISLLNQYVSQISTHNYVNGIRYLAACTGMDQAYEAPRPVQTHGIYHPDAQGLFRDANTYLHWLTGKFPGEKPLPMIGMTSYYGQIVEKNHEDIDAVIRALESHGMMPFCVCSEGARDAAFTILERYPWLVYFQDAIQWSVPPLAAIINIMSGRLLSTPEDAHVFQALNVPVFQMIRLYHQSPDEWAKDDQGLGSGGFGVVYGLAQQEMAGVIEPTMAAGSISRRDAGTEIDVRRYMPVPERIDHLCRRLRRWIKLQTLPNSRKRVTIILNNNPCKSVEATLGTAVGLDTFESLARFIGELRAAGYHVGDAPEKGRPFWTCFSGEKPSPSFAGPRWTRSSVKAGPCI